MSTASAAEAGTASTRASTSKIFLIKESTPLNTDLELKEARQIRLGPFVINLPNFRKTEAQIVIKSPKTPDIVLGQRLLGNEVPIFTLPTTYDTEFGVNSLRGKASVITFVNSWSPPSVEQISVMDSLIVDDEVSAVMVSVQETPSRLKILQTRGSYEEIDPIRPCTNKTHKIKVLYFKLNFTLFVTGYWAEGFDGKAICVRRTGALANSWFPNGNPDR